MKQARENVAWCLAWVLIAAVGLLVVGVSLVTSYYLFHFVRGSNLPVTTETVEFAGGNLTIVRRVRP